MTLNVMLDPGHGGMDPGAVYEGRMEKDDVLRLALAVGEILQNHGINVEYTRTEDVYDSPYEKAMKGNASGADLFVSLHRNSYPVDNVVSGVETLVYDDSGKKAELANAINEQLEAVGFVNLGVTERPNLVVLRKTDMPAVLVEVGFINSNTDNQLFDKNFDAIAQGIADGILDVFGEEEKGMQPVYKVQVGLFRNRAYAERLLNELLEQDYPAFLTTQNGLNAVQVGSYTNMDEAAAMELRLKRAGYPTIILTS